MPDLTPTDLALIADALRTWTLALDHAGLAPCRYVTQEQAAAVAKLMELCPADKPVDTNGDVTRTGKDAHVREDFQPDLR
jgi:hypothetical protein